MEPAEEFIIQDVETLKLITHPLRLQLLGQFKRKRTVKEAAAELETPPTKLYYHVNLMEEKGLIQVVDTQIVSGIVEKRYQVAAHRFRIDDTMLSGETGDGFDASRFDALIAPFFQMAHNEIRHSMRTGLLDFRDKAKPHHGSLARMDFCLTEEQAEALHGRIQAIVDEYKFLSKENDAKGDGRAYALTTTYFPIGKVKSEK